MSVKIFSHSKTFLHPIHSNLYVIHSDFQFLFQVSYSQTVILLYSFYPFIFRIPQLLNLHSSGLIMLQILNTFTCIQYFYVALL